MHITDWNPTLCDFAGGCPLPSAQPLDGVSARGLISSGDDDGGAGASSLRTEIVHDICRTWMGGPSERVMSQSGGRANEPRGHCWRTQIDFLGLVVVVVILSGLSSSRSLTGSCLEHLAGALSDPDAQYSAIMRADGYKLIVGQLKKGGVAEFTPLLFHIATDPSESTDLSGTEAGKQIVQQMLATLAQHEKTAGVAHDRDPIDPRSDPRLHGGAWMPWE